MKKIARHFMALFLSLVMIMAMGLTAFAEPDAGGTTTYKLTLTGTATGHTYEAYQIFTGDLSTNTEGKKVLSNVAWGNGVTYNGTESAADVAKALADKMMTIAQLEEKLKLTTAAKTVASAKDSTVIDGLAAGYYLVKDKDGTQANTSDAYTQFVVQVVGDTTTQIKSDVPTVEKKVKDANETDGTTTGWQDSADYKIGADIPYQITGTMPDNIADYTTYKYVFTDTMSKGLTYTDKTATVKIGDTDVTSSFIEKVTPQTDGSTVVTWSCDDLTKISGVTLDANSKVIVTYNAKLNGNAVIGFAGNPNTVNLTYSNNPNKGGEGETGKTPDDKNIVFTYKTVVNKVDQDKKPLAGAAFTLQKKVNGTYQDVQTIGPKDTEQKDITNFEFKGLDDGDYKLTETTTPAGYNTITPVEFTISAEHDTDSADPKLTKLSGNDTTGEVTFTADKDAGSLTTEIVNKKGSLLPSTGGRGTTFLYLGGAVLVVVMGTLFVLKKKMSRDR